jgi:hypothetical protein
LTKRTLFLSFRDDDAAFHKDLLLPEKNSAKHDILSWCLSGCKGTAPTFWSEQANEDH